MLSPAFTSTISSVMMSDILTSSRWPLSITLIALLGNSSAIFFKASPAFPTAFISIQCPNSIIKIKVANSQKVHCMTSGTTKVIHIKSIQAINISY